MGATPSAIAAHQASQAELRAREAQALEQAKEQSAPDTPAPEDGLDIWPWHVDALKVFDFMQTQARVAPVGMGGLVWIGLDHCAFPEAFAALELPRKRQPELRRQVKVMELEAVRLLNRRPV